MNIQSAKEKAIQELMSYLDEKDGEELGSVIKPKKAAVEITKIEGGEPDGDEGMESKSPGVHGEPDGDEAMAMMDKGDAEGAEPKMSEEEMEELIEALQSKLGA